MKKNWIVWWGLFLCFGVVEAQVNTLTQKEVQQGWKLLFNGENLDGWTSVGKDTPPEKGWDVEDGVLTVNKGGYQRGGDIITKGRYWEFDLMFEFRLTKGANSGLKYFFTRYEKGGWLGLEYQILDDQTHPDAKLGRDGNRLQGGLYDMFPPAKNKKDRPIGEWNQGRIVSRGTKVEHYLNGKKILSFDRKSKDYMEAYQLSKFKDSEPVFGDVLDGHILLQEHQDEVSFRNIKIRVLSEYR